MLKRIREWICAFHSHHQSFISKRQFFINPIFGFVGCIFVRFSSVGRGGFLSFHHFNLRFADAVIRQFCAAVVRFKRYSACGICSSGSQFIPFLMGFRINHRFIFIVSACILPKNFHLCGCNMARSGNKATEI